MEPDILLSPPFLAGRVSDFQGRGQTVSNTQQEHKYLLQISSTSKTRIFMRNLLSLAWTTAVDTSRPSNPSSTLLPESTFKKMQSQCSPAQNPLVAPIDLVS